MTLDRRSRPLILLLLIVATLGAGKYLADRRDDAAAARAALNSGPARDGVPVGDLAAVPDSVMASPPPSPWLEARTRRYSSLFRNWQCDVLVVPVQVEGAGFDRPNRQIMTAQLALALAAPGTCVADPFLADIALGDGLRRRNSDAVQELARSIKASSIVSAYAGHDEAGRMRVTLQVARLDPGNSGAAPKVTAHSFENLHYDPAQPPFVAFQAQLPHMLEAVGLKAAAPSSSPPGAMPEALPDSLDSFQHPEQETPMAQAARLSFLAMLAPGEWRATDRLFSKAWAALENADAADPAVRLLRARIMFHLQERPFALAQLGDAAGPAEDGLRAVLNGNLPQARQALAQLHNPWDQFFLGLEVHDLELSYAREPRHSASQVLQLFDGSPWQLFAALRLGDRDTWSVSSTVWLKQLLDKQFPIAGFSLADSGIGRAMLAVFDRPDAEVSTLRHVYRLAEEQPRLWCCASFDAAPRASDLLDLLDSRVEFTLGRQAYYLYFPQNAYDQALQVLQRYDSVLAGSPCAEELRAWIYWAQMGRKELGKNEDLNRRLRDSARLTVWLEQGQTSDSNNMLWYLYQPPIDPAAQSLIKYTDDFPVRPYWSGHGHTPNIEQRLAFSTENTQPLAELLKGSSGDNRTRYLAMLDSRFIGGADATQLRLDNLSAQIKTPEYLRLQIAADPDNYRYYSTLGYLLINQNAFTETSRTMLSYPLYHEEHPNDPVALSHHAGSWGDALFWLGAMKEARPLFQLAADYQTGSGGSVNSAARLALLDQDYSGAANGFLEAAQHYSDMFDYREFLDLTFASGQDQAGWALFDHLLGQYDAPALWGAAMTAHRVAGLGSAGLREWTGQRLSRLPADASRDDLLSYALLEEFTDRVPAADFAAYIKQLAGDARVALQPNGQVVAANAPPANAEVLGPSQFGHERHAKIIAADTIPNRYAVLAEALAAQSAGHYADAVAAFDRLSAYYKIEDGSLSFALPYFAYAAAKTGDSLGLQKYLDSLPDDATNYDVALARAVFYALAGKHDQAQAQLDKAFHFWPYGTSMRDLRSGYEYLDICAALFEATGDARYRQAALRLGRTLRQVEPTRAYGQALVAYLGDQENERVEALAMALYLDPRSRWAALAPAALRVKALSWSKRHPLFAADSIWQSRAQAAAAD